MRAKVKPTTETSFESLRLLPEKENAAPGFPVGRQSIALHRACANPGRWALMEEERPGAQAVRDAGLRARPARSALQANAASAVFIF